VELLVVITILVILGGIVVPYAVGGNDSEASSAARLVASDLQYAQSEAIATQMPVKVAFSTSSGSYTLSNTSGALVHPIKKSAYTTRFASETGLEDVRLLSVAFASGTSCVTFDAMGAPTSPGTIKVQAGGSLKYVVEVAAVTGKVTVSSTSR
jgi:Tfp pilus assembly protein FimT